jgi:hypothetical protein
MRIAHDIDVVEAFPHVVVTTIIQIRESKGVTALAKSGAWDVFGNAIKSSYE